MRPQSLHSDQNDERRRGNGERRPGRFGDMVNDAQEIGEEAVLVDMDSEQLRHLVQHDHEPYARLEPDQDGFADETDESTQAQQPRQHAKTGNDECGQSRDGCPACRIAFGRLSLPLQTGGFR